MTVEKGEGFSKRGSEFTEEVFEELLEDLEYHVENGVKSRVVVADWNGIEHLSEKRDEIDLVESSDLGFEIFYDGIYFGFRQTRLRSDYEIGSLEQGYGFQAMKCLSCDTENLLFDTEEEMHYCPVCD